MSNNDQGSYEQGKAPAHEEEPQGFDRDQDPISNLPAQGVADTVQRQGRYGPITPANAISAASGSLDSSGQDDNSASSERSSGESDTSTISSLEDQNVTMTRNSLPAGIKAMVTRTMTAMLAEFRADILRSIATAPQALGGLSPAQGAGGMSQPSQGSPVGPSPEAGLATKSDDPPKRAESLTDQKLKIQPFLNSEGSYRPQLGSEADM